MTRDQWLLTGAWAAMAAVGALSIYKGSKAPEIDPGISKLCEDIQTLERLTPGRFPPPKDRLLYMAPDHSGPIIDIFPDIFPVRPINEGGSLFRTVAVGHGVEPDVIYAKVLPFPVLQTIKSDLDGTVVTWTTEDRSVDLLHKMIRVAADPVAISVFRQHDEETPEKVAELGPKARSYTDLSAQPRRTYRYWVTFTGLETIRTDRSGKMIEVTNAPDRRLSAAAPSATRVSLVGGDRTHAFLKVETYDRAKMGWVAKSPVLTAPGEKVAGTGWSLKGLRFENFTLVADVTDDDGAVQVLTTRN